jgi:hypothetical protein
MERPGVSAVIGRRDISQAAEVLMDMPAWPGSDTSHTEPE